MEKVIDGIEFSPGTARVGKDGPAIALIAGKILGVDWEFFSVGKYESDSEADAAAAAYLEQMTSVPADWKSRFAVPGAAK